MPRHARLHAPGSVVHVIARIVNREFRIVGAQDRDVLLDRLAQSLLRTDWRLVAYALMSNHYHLVLVAGQAPPWQLLKPFHTAAARWFNRTQGRLGPVFAERATTLLVPAEQAGRLIAYVHNNPVRAHVAGTPLDTDWTSHRAFVGLQKPVPGLDIEAGLRLAGCNGTATGRKRFHGLVLERMSELRDSRWNGASLRQGRAHVRAELALPVELSSPWLDEQGELRAAVLHLGTPGVLPRWPGDLERLLQRVCEARRIGREELCSPSRRPPYVDARRLAVTVGARLLRRNVNELAAALGIAATTASMLLRRADRVMEEAIRLATALRMEDASAPLAEQFLGS